MTVKRQILMLFVGSVAFAALSAGAAQAIAPSRLADTDEKNASDWLTYHGTYRSYHFSPLTRSTPTTWDSSRSPGCISPAARRADCSQCRSSRTEFSIIRARIAGSLPSTARPAR